MFTVFLFYLCRSLHVVLGDLSSKIKKASEITGKQPYLGMLKYRCACVILDVSRFLRDVIKPLASIADHIFVYKSYSGNMNKSGVILKEGVRDLNIPYIRFSAGRNDILQVQISCLMAISITMRSVAQVIQALRDAIAKIIPNSASQGYVRLPSEDPASTTTET
jgi:hypothetical protein